MECLEFDYVLDQLLKYVLVVYCSPLAADLSRYICTIYNIYIYISGFLSGFGPRGGKTAICNLVGGGHGSLNMHRT